MEALISTTRPIRDVLPVRDSLIVVQHDDAVRIYDWSNGAFLRTLATGSLGHLESSLALHPNGQDLVVATKSRVAVFALDSASSKAHVDVQLATGVAVMSDGARALFIGRPSGTEVTLCEWTLGNAPPKELSQFGKYHNAKGLLLTPDEHVWISLSTHLWRVNLQTGGTWESPREDRCLGKPSWIEDSNAVAVGTLDGCVQIWGCDAPSKQAEIRVGPKALHEVHAVSFGRGLIAASSGDQRVNILAPGDKSPAIGLRGRMRIFQR